jgi:hypothetical protein
MRRGMKRMKASSTKTTNGVKATATMETATAVEPPTMETTTTVEAAATTVETAATSMAAPTTTARLGDVREYQPHDCAREDASERQPEQFIVRSSQHSFLPQLPAAEKAGSASGFLSKLQVVTGQRQRN